MRSKRQSPQYTAISGTEALNPQLFQVSRGAQDMDRKRCENRLHLDLWPLAVVIGIIASTTQVIFHLHQVNNQL